MYEYVTVIFTQFINFCTCQKYGTNIKNWLSYVVTYCKASRSYWVLYGSCCFICCGIVLRKVWKRECVQSGLAEFG